MRDGPSATPGIRYPSRVPRDQRAEYSSVMAVPPRPTGNSPVWRVLGLLPEYKQHGAQFAARCPAHEDSSPSLSIKEGSDGRALVLCRAGCATEKVLTALGLTFADLYEQRDGGVVRRFRVVDRSGKLIARHERIDWPDRPKKMGWESNGRKTLDGKRLNGLPLYRLPELLEAPRGSTVYVTEGEGKADALADRGLVAVGTVTGSEGDPDPEVLAPLNDYRVILWPDNDDVGHAHMERIAARLNMHRPPQWLDWPEAPPKGDAVDYFQAGGTVAGLADLVRAWRPRQAELAVTETAVSWNLISSTDLARMVLPEPRWAVPGIVPEGVLLVAGKPKFGKSWWVFDLCVAITIGSKAWGRIPVEQGDVLYITYEDSYRRLQDRQQRLAGHERGVPGLEFVTDCPRSDQGGIELVLDWVKHHPRARLIVIDPLEYWRPEENAKKQLYRQDYESMRPIVEAARSLGISVIVVHHCNKMVSPDDPFDSISGTTGLQGVADAIGVFRRETGFANAVLFIKGKDVDFGELAFRTRIGDAYPAPAWELLGSGEEYRLSKERFETLEALWREPWQLPGSLAEIMDPPVTKGTMRKRLFDMSHDSLVRVSDGKYSASMTRDNYLARYGLDQNGAFSPNGNAGNAGTPVHPVPRVQSDESTQSTNVPSVPVVPSVTSVTDPKPCPDCGGNTDGPWSMLCRTCLERRKQPAAEIRDLEL